MGHSIRIITTLIFFLFFYFHSLSTPPTHTLEMKPDTPLLQDAEIPLSPAELEVIKNLSLNHRSKLLTILNFRYFVDNTSRKENTLRFKPNSTMHGDSSSLRRLSILNLVLNSSQVNYPREMIMKYHHIKSLPKRFTLTHRKEEENVYTF